MNKLITKIAGACLGLAMAIGVGVAVGNDTKSAEPVHASISSDEETGLSVLTSSNFDTSAEYVLKSTDGYYWNGVSGTSSSKWGGITKTLADVARVSIDGTWSDGFTIKDSSNNYLRATTGNMTWATTTPGTFKMGTDSASNPIVFNGTTNGLKVNGTSGMRLYTNLTYNASTGKSVALYQIPTAKTLSSISLSGTYPTTFTTGDSFDHTGMTVTAHYSDSTTANVTSSATFSGYNMSTAGNYTVTVSYTEGGATKTATYSITVSAPSTPFITPAKSSTSGYTGTNESLSFTYGNLTGSLSVTSSNTSVVTVGTPSTSAGSGTVQINFVAEGSTTVKFKDGSTELASVSVSVSDPTVTITGMPSARSIATGATLNLGSLITVTPTGNLSGDVTWSSSNSSFASVTQSGVVTGEAIGSAIITVTPDDYPAGAVSCTVTVANVMTAVFGTTGSSSSTEVTDGSKYKTDYSYTIDTNITLSDISKVYPQTSNALKFGSSSVVGSMTFSIPSTIDSKPVYITSVTVRAVRYHETKGTTMLIGGVEKALTYSADDYTADLSSGEVTSFVLTADSSSSDKRMYVQSVSIQYAFKKTLNSIALSGSYQTSFTKGDTFSHSGMIVTANYSDSTSAVVTGSATWSSPDMSTTGSKTITVSYSDAYGSASTTYSISVNYAAPTSITLSHNSGAVALEETFDVSEIGVTINPSATADQTAYTWSLYDDGDLVEDTDYVWISPEIMSYTAGTFVFRCTSTEDGTKYAEFTLTVSGDPLAQLKDESDEDVTSGSKTVYADAGIISFSVTAENFQGTLTYTWSSSNTSIIDIDADADDMCDYEVKAAGSARLSCRIQGSVKGDVTVYVDVTVTAVTVTSVTWTAPTIDVFSGSTLTASDASSWNVKYSTNSGKTDQTPDSFDVKLGGSTISLPHTWAAADDGKTLCVEVGGVSSSTTTVTVTQSINAVMASSTDSWDYTFETKAWSAAGDHALDDKTWTMSGTDDGTPYFGYDATKGQQFGSGTHPFSDVSLQSSDFSGTIDSVTVYTSGANSINATVQVSVGGTAYGSAQTITNTNTAYTFDLGGKSGTISIDYINSSSKAIYVKEIVVNTVSGSQNIANVATHKAAQRVAVKFANAFNAAMDDTEYCTTGLSTAWSACSSAYNTFKSEAAALGETEEAYAKNLIKYATAQYSNDSGEACIERMMKTYEVCVNKHGQTEFMSDLITLGRASTPSPLTTINGVSNTTIVIVVMTSLVGVAAIGGYFFLRKRKEK